MHHNASTYLWIGPEEYIKKQALALIQKNYCAEKGCQFCSLCKQIEAMQFFASMVLSTTKSSYSRSDLDVIFSKIAFQHSESEPFFCIIMQAEKLSISCANSLLKLLEEPPQGWHWILQTDRPQELLPTIMSRCIVKEFDAVTPLDDYRELFLLLTNTKQGDGALFQQLDRTKISDYESRLLFDEIFNFWIKKAQTHEYYLSIVQVLSSFIEKQPMPGSSKIFWRTVYLKMYSLLE